MGKSFQKIAEDKANIFFKKITSEFEIPLDKYPKIFYIKRDTKFEDIKLKNKNLEDFEYVKNTRRATCNPKNLAIFTRNLYNYVIAEEVGHYIHFSHAKFENKTSIGDFYFGAFAEMLGFFSSKLINSKRKNEFRTKKNPLNEIQEINNLFEYIHENRKENICFNENLIYINGYSLGEKMFEKYVKGKIPKKEIYEAFTTLLDSEVEAIYQFYKWKNKLLK